MLKERSGLKEQREENILDLRRFKKDSKNFIFDVKGTSVDSFKKTGRRLEFKQVRKINIFKVFSNFVHTPEYLF